MEEKNYPTRALAAYSRAMARQKRVNLPIDDLPSRVFEATIAERNYAIMSNGSRTLAVYRVTPGGFLRRLKRWSKDIHRRT